jgi:hypothetical protein
VAAPGLALHDGDHRRRGHERRHQRHDQPPAAPASVLGPHLRPTPIAFAGGTAPLPLPHARLLMRRPGTAVLQKQQPGSPRGGWARLVSRLQLAGWVGWWLRAACGASICDCRGPNKEPGFFTRIKNRWVHGRG